MNPNQDERRVSTAPATQGRAVWLAWAGEYDDLVLLGVFETEIAALRVLVDERRPGQRIERLEVKS